MNEALRRVAAALLNIQRYYFTTQLSTQSWFLVNVGACGGKIYCGYTLCRSALKVLYS